MEIKTGRMHGDRDPAAVVVPPDKGRPARKKAAQKLQRSGQPASRLLAALRVLGGVSLIALLIVSGFAAVRYARTADALRLRNVRIDGCKNADPAALEALVRHDFPANILRIDLGELRTRLQREPWILNVEVRRILPYSLDIRVQERVPSVVAEVGGELALLDREGVLLDSYNSAYGKLDVPVFTGLKGDDTESYRVMQEENSLRVRLGVQVLTELASGPSDYTCAISEIDLADTENVKVLLVNDNVEVLLGDRDFLGRFQTFMSNLSHLEDLKSEGKEIDEVDLRFANQIVYRLRHTASEETESKTKLIRN